MSKQNGVSKLNAEHAGSASMEEQPPMVIDSLPQITRIVPLTPLQRDYLQQYAISLNQASAKVEAARTALRLAEEAEGLAQSAANAFLRFCSEDLDVDLRVWQFDQPNLRFILIGEGMNGGSANG